MVRGPLVIVCSSLTIKEAEERSCSFRCAAAQSFLKEGLRELLGICRTADQAVVSTI